jgi:hypothetical protein
MKRFVAGLAVGVAATTAATAFAAGPWPGNYAWFTGDNGAGIGRLGPALSMFSLHDLNVHAGHVRIEAEDGNVELESKSSVATTTLNPYNIGTAQRKPLQVGWPDGEDVLPLLVAGNAKQRHNLQEWHAGSKTVAAIDSKGSLHLGSFALSASLVNGRVVLVATLPNGTRKTLATGRAG